MGIKKEASKKNKITRSTLNKKCIESNRKHYSVLGNKRRIEYVSKHILCLGRKHQFCNISINEMQMKISTGITWTSKAISSVRKRKIWKNYKENSDKETMTSLYYEATVTETVGL